jgi:hypothetical protein
MAFSCSLFPPTGDSLRWADLRASGIHFDKLERDALALNKTHYQLVFIRWLDINDPSLLFGSESLDSRARRRFSEDEVSLLKNGNGGGEGEIAGIRDAEVVNYYADLIEQNMPFPPLLLSMLYGKLALWDGWHRLNAWRGLGIAGIPAVIATDDMASIQEYLDRANDRESITGLEITDGVDLPVTPLTLGL